MFRERYIKRVADSNARAELALFIIGVSTADSYIYRAGYVEQHDLDTLLDDGMVGDIATVFFRAVGNSSKAVLLRALLAER